MEIKETNYNALQSMLSDIIDSTGYDSEPEMLMDYFGFKDTDIQCIERCDTIAYDAEFQIENHIKDGIESISSDCGLLYRLDEIGIDTDYIVVDGIDSRKLTVDELRKGISNILDSDDIRQQMFNYLTFMCHDGYTADDALDVLQDEYSFLDFTVDGDIIKHYNDTYNDFSKSLFDSLIQFRVKE